MAHPDFNPAWLEELDEAAAASAEHIISVGERTRITKRNRRILHYYIEAIRDVGLARAMRQTVATFDDEGISETMIADATRLWRESHGAVRRTANGATDDARLAAFDAAVGALVRVEERIVALEAFVAGLEERIVFLERKNEELGRYEGDARPAHLLPDGS